MTTDVISAHPATRAGFIGSGFMAEVHSRAARAARGVLVGAASSSPASALSAAERLGMARAYDSADELFADDSIDIVHICTPNTTHAAYAIAALEAGKHVICEKPLAISGEEAQRMADAAEASGLTATVPFAYRFHPMVREARARVAAGELGTLFTISGSYLQDWLLTPSDDNWRVNPQYGGPSRAFADIGSHLCDLIEFVSGERISRLVSTKRTVFPQRSTNASVETEDALAIVVETEGGAIGTLLISQVAPGRKNQLVFELGGSAESVRFDQEQPESLWIGRRDESRIVVRDGGTLSADAARLSNVPSGHPMGYQDAFNAFVADSYAAARGETPEGLPTFADGLRAARITDAVLESADSGQWVTVPAATPVVTR